VPSRNSSLLSGNYFSYDQLFVAIVKPHKPVTSCTIARWLKEVLKLSGIDVSSFTPHSTRSISVSAAADSGMTTSDILKAADWSTEPVFYYCLPETLHMAGLCCLQQVVRPDCITIEC